MADMDKHDRIVWIDLEMTGLDIHEHTIVEVAALITDADLNVLCEGVDVVVHASEEELGRMNEFVTNMHESSGLLAEIRESKVTLKEAEDAVLELIAKHCDSEHPAPLAGNSIGTDRGFIREYMPRLDEALHYRMIDVSTVKELARRWAPRVYYHQPEKDMSHRALADIVESIRKLDFYRRVLFVADPRYQAWESAQAAAIERYQEYLQP